MNGNVIFTDGQIDETVLAVLAGRRILALEYIRVTHEDYLNTNQIRVYYLFGTISDAVHPLYPFHMPLRL